jgi:glutamine synthetase
VRSLKNFKDATWREKVNEVIARVQAEQIKFVRLQFTDLNGILKSLAVNSKNFENIFENG